MVWKIFIQSKIGKKMGWHQYWHIFSIIKKKERKKKTKSFPLISCETYYCSKFVFTEVQPTSKSYSTKVRIIVGWYMNNDIFYGSSLLIIGIITKHFRSCMEVLLPKIVVAKCRVSQLDEKGEFPLSFGLMNFKAKIIISIC